MKILALIGICLVLSLAGCGGTGSDPTTGGSSTSETAAAKETVSLAPTVEMSKAEIAKLPPLTIPKQSGPPPRHLEIVDLRKGTGPGVPKNNLLTNREQILIRHFVVSYPEALKGPKTGQYGPRKLLPGETVEGVARGLTGMKVGGRRELIIPPWLVYTHWKPSWGYAPFVDVYVVDLLGMEPPHNPRLEHPELEDGS
jgi:peptidylprolyl isomerase